MQSLYSNGFETIYDEMYQTFINYRKEFDFYSKILNQYNKKQVLEIGSGTGNLANYFIKNQYNYLGLDYSNDMITLAKRKTKTNNFLKGNMCDFKLKNKTESVIITGRTTSYLLSNEDVHNGLSSIYKNLKKGGILCFDFIDANRFFKTIKNGKKFKHYAKFNSKKYYRDSFLNTNTSNNFMFDWESKYYEENNNSIIAHDKSEVRAFTRNEWEILLHLNNFEVLKFIDKPAYMFDCLVVIAKKQ